MREEREWDLELYYEGQNVEELREHIYFPIYQNCYEEAIRDIYIRLLREGNLSRKIGEKYRYVYQDNDSRIISFIGGRGTGKSTAVAEFCHILNGLEDDKERKWWIDHSISREKLREDLYAEKLNFKILGIIEASNLEDKEDLFELIMASIFRQWEEKMQSARQNYEDLTYKKTEFQKNFNSIMNGYYALKNARSEEFGDSYISKLKTMSSSMDIREKIKDLIDRVLSLFYGNSGKSFLVITIDDLDLNIVHGYEMLEQLHKYFFLPNVLILMSGDYDQIGYVCKYHYVKEFSGGRSHVIEQSIMEHCRELSRDYIAKTLPLDLCVYMPEMRKNTKKILVENDTQLKLFLMRMIAEKMYIHYDIDGLKSHFSEAHTVRELVHYHQFLDSLAVIDFARWMADETPEEKRREYMNLYDKNHEQFNHDIRHRMADNFLSENQKKIFSGVLDKSLEVRAIEACKILRNDEEENNDIFGGWDYLQEPDYDEDKYTYGDLIQGIYEYGRQNEMNKSFVKCILASFTSEMVREKISFTLNPDESSKGYSLRRINQFLGKTIGNHWLGQMVPPIKEDEKGLASFGYNAHGSTTLLDFSFEVKLDDLEDSIKGYVKGKANKKIISRYWGNYKKILETNHVIPTLECIAMFLIPLSGNANSVPDNKDWVEFIVSVKEGKEVKEDSVGEKEENKSKYFLSFKGQNKNVVFDIFGFVKKSINYRPQIDMFLENLTKSIVSGILGYLSEKSTDISTDNRDYLFSLVHRTVMSNSLFSNSHWEENSGAFPFYDLDLAYNVLKRTRRELLEENPETINLTGCYEYIKRAYVKLIDVLKRQDDKYKEWGISLNYAEQLRTYPFIDTFMNARERLTSEFETLFGENISKMLLLTVVSDTDQPENEVKDEVKNKG